MELPHLGQHCSERTCHKLDFLPMKCDACNQIFCTEHFNYASHNCPSAYKKNVEVPVCPLCNRPVPLIRGQLPDITVSAHIDDDCQSDRAKNRRKVFTNRCSMKGCKTKEVVPVLCTECTLNFCLKHRHPTDHKCEGKTAAQRKNTMNAALSRVTHRNEISAIQGTMDEDEALARALALSLQDENVNKNSMSQEELDAALARQLQLQEHQLNRTGINTATTASTSTGSDAHSGRRDRCRLS